MNSHATALNEARKKIISLQQEMTERVIKLAEEVEKLDAILPSKENREFLRTRCGLATSEISTFSKFSATLKGHRETLLKRRVPFTVIKRLVSTTEDVRTEAISRIASGARFDLSDLIVIKKSFNKLSEFEMIARTQRKTVRRIVKARTSEKLARLESDADVLMSKIAELPQSSFRPSVQNQVAAIKEDARRVLPQFEELLGSDHPFPSDASFTAVKRGEARVAFAHRALTNLAFWLDTSGRSIAEQAELIAREKEAFAGAIARAIGNMKYQTPRPRPWKVPRGALKALTKRRLSALELCAGAGGMALGLEAAGFKHVALVEMNADAAATMRTNRPEWPVVEADMTTIDFTRYAGKVDLVCGGLPCQPWSEEGEGLGMDDPRDLLMEGARVVRQVKPKAFVFENVRGLLHAPHAAQLARFVKELAGAGYEVQIVEVNTKDFGIAQDRPRVLILGMQAQYRKVFKMPPKFPERRANLGSLLLDLMSAKGWSGASSWAKERQEQIFEGEDGSSAVGALAWTLKGRQGKARFFEARRWAGVGLTAAGLPDEAPTDELVNGAGGSFVPGMTLRMRARIQDFPDDYVFCGGKESVAKQIGNAVAPRLAQAIGLAIHAAINRCEFDYEAILWPEDLTTRPDAEHRIEIVPPPIGLDTSRAEEYGHGEQVERAIRSRRRFAAT